ncbi:MAG: hypothetical protein DRI24_19855 [Deltaproteobacteria bacterium]|nr:MAG: hypothetical protein DRI24_19855 [Deltaproteobacteria bacterium]
MIRVKAEFVCDSCHTSSFDGDVYLTLDNKACSSMTCEYESNHPEVPDGWNFVEKPAWDLLSDYVIKEWPTSGGLMYCPKCSEGLRRSRGL